jgi:hypothetical protein
MYFCAHVAQNSGENFIFRIFKAIFFLGDILTWNEVENLTKQQLKTCNIYVLLFFKTIQNDKKYMDGLLGQAKRSKMFRTFFVSVPIEIRHEKSN